MDIIVFVVLATATAMAFLCQTRRLAGAEKCTIVLYKKALGADPTSALRTVNNLGKFRGVSPMRRACSNVLWLGEGTLVDTELKCVWQYGRNLTGKEKLLAPFWPDQSTSSGRSTLINTERMYGRALAGKERHWEQTILSSSSQSTTLRTSPKIKGISQMRSSQLELRSCWERATARQFMTSTSICVSPWRREYMNVPMLGEDDSTRTTLAFFTKFKSGRCGAYVWPCSDWNKVVGTLRTNVHDKYGMSGFEIPECE